MAQKGDACNKEMRGLFCVHEGSRNMRKRPFQSISGAASDSAASAEATGGGDGAALQAAAVVAVAASASDVVVLASCSAVPPTDAAAAEAAYHMCDTVSQLRAAATNSSLTSVCCHGMSRCVIQATTADGRALLLNCECALDVGEEGARAMLRDEGEGGGAVMVGV